MSRPWSALSALLVALFLPPGGLEGQAGPPTRLEVRASPPWPGITIEAVGLGVSGQTDAQGSVVLAVPPSTVELRGTTPFGEVVARLVEVGRFNDVVTLTFPGLLSSGSSLAVTTLPGARVEMEGVGSRATGEDGVATFHGLLPGRHALLITEPSGRTTVRRVVSIEMGASETLRVSAAAFLPDLEGAETPVTPEVGTGPLLEIPAGTGLVTLRSSEDAVVYLDGAPLGAVGPSAPLTVRLPSGPVELRLSATDGRSILTVLDVADGVSSEAGIGWAAPESEPSASFRLDPQGLLLMLVGFLVTAGAGVARWRRRRASVDPESAPRSRTATAMPGSDLQTDSSFNEMSVLRLIGRGGMGSVYEVEDSQGAKAALKVLESASTGDPASVHRFFREARVLQAINSAFPAAPVVRVFRFGHEGDSPEGRPFILMELLGGRSLQAVICDQGIPPANTAIHIVEQVARALQAAHFCGVYHRDLTPENVMLSGEHMARPEVRVIDFGVAKHEHTRVHTLDRSVFGKPSYMAPEVWHGGPVDGRTDLYSLGVILYLLLTGTVPFDDPNALVVMNMHQSTPAPALPPDVPTELQNIVMRLLEKDPGRRFQDADGLLKALSAAAGDPSTSPPLAAGPFRGRRT